MSSLTPLAPLCVGDSTRWRRESYEWSLEEYDLLGAKLRWMISLFAATAAPAVAFVTQTQLRRLLEDRMVHLHEVIRFLDWRHDSFRESVRRIEDAETKLHSSFYVSGPTHRERSVIIANWKLLTKVQITE